MKRKVLIKLPLLAAATIAFSLFSSCASNKVPVEIPCINNPEPKGETFLLEGFEEGNFWEAVGSSWDQWGSHNLSLKSDVSEEWSTEGKTSGIWTFDIMSEESSKQASFSCSILLKNDWTQYTDIVADINNISEQPLQVNIAIQDSLEYKWMETQTLTLGKGENTNVSFSLIEGLESEGNPISGLIHGEQIHRMMIQVLGENLGGQIMVDKIRLVKREPEPEPEPAAE